MIETQLKTIEKTTIDQIDQSNSLDALDAIRVSVLGKKGELTGLLKQIGQLPADQRPEMGQKINVVKSKLSTQLDDKLQTLKDLELQHKLDNGHVDITAPSPYTTAGTSHPITQVTHEICDILGRIGYSVKTGPEIETDFYNFEALNIPADHPARDMHDTFYLDDDRLLRTHTSSVQIHVMETDKPPIQIIVPGRVYRCDADVSHSPMFHQVEGLVVDKGISMADLKSTLEYLLKELFGQHRKVRFRSSYFPFTEPSAEVDVECVMCDAKGCGVCRQTGWLEILGCGMVNENVLKAVNIDTNFYTGFAFGLGVERIAMLKYKIPSIKRFCENDVRFLSQF